MNRILAVVLAAAALSAPAQADDLTGRMGVGGALGPAVPAGSKWVTDGNDPGLGLGGWLSYGILPRLSARASYDDLGMTRRAARMQPLQFGAAYALCPDSKLNPSLRAGAGPAWVRGVPTSAEPRLFGFSVGAAVDYFVTRRVTVGAAVDWFAALRQNSSRTDTHVLRPAVTLGYWFGGSKQEPKQVQAQPAPAPVQAAPPAAPSVALTLSPASAELGAGQSQPFAAQVTGTPDKSVTWSLEPQAGAISAAGVYTAPASIALAQIVRVTATSVADPSKRASTEVRLKAPEKVEIALKVEFDTAKDVVKPEYDGELAKVASFLKDYPSASAEIEGHTDSLGKAEYNRDLSQRRADAVRRALIERFHVDPARLTAKGYGPDRPIADNGTAEGRAKNRRVAAAITATKP